MFLIVFTMTFDVLLSCFALLIHFILYVLIYSYSLEESGSTALGPALVVSIAMAAKVPGSRVS